MNLSLKSIDFQDIMASLQTGEIDIALVLESDGWKMPELHYEQLVREKMMITSPPLEKNLELVAILYTERSCSYKAVFNDYLHHKKMKVKESLEFQSIEAIKQCVRSGLGISMVPIQCSYPQFGTRT